MTKSLSIPFYYTLFFLYIEPISALAGAYYAYFQPDQYLHDTYHLDLSAITSQPRSTYIVLTQLANLYLLFAINEALVLRSSLKSHNLDIFKTVLVGLLIADFGHLWSLAGNGYGDEVYWTFWEWNAMMWGNIGFVYLGALTRIAFLAGMGLGSSKKGRKVA